MFGPSEYCVGAMLGKSRFSTVCGKCGIAAFRGGSVSGLIHESDTHFISLILGSLKKLHLSLCASPLWVANERRQIMAIDRMSKAMQAQLGAMRFARLPNSSASGTPGATSSINAAGERGMLKAFLRREASQSDRVDQLLQAERNTPRQQRVLFLYWGRRGLSEFALMLAEAARARSDFHAVFSVSRQNDRFDEFQRLGECVEPIDTFESNIGALFAVWRVRRARNQILARIHRDRINTVVSLMPHVWTPLVAPSIRAAGVKFVSLIHDAMPHPGDVKSLVASWAFRDLQNSDLILTLSEHVTRSLKNGDKVDPSIVRTLFHPHLRFSEPTRPAWPSAGQPFRVLFLGRALALQGPRPPDRVPSRAWVRRDWLFSSAILVKALLELNADRLKAIGAEVENRWLSAERNVGDYRSLSCHCAFA